MGNVLKATSRTGERKRERMRAKEMALIEGQERSKCEAGVASGTRQVWCDECNLTMCQALF